MTSRARTDGVLNKTTGTVHKQEIAEAGLKSVCGVTYNVPEGSLQSTDIGTAIELRHTAKCGRCFDDGRGY